MFLFPRGLGTLGVETITQRGVLIAVICVIYVILRYLRFLRYTLCVYLSY